MKPLLLLALGLAWNGPLAAQPALAEYDWQRLGNEGRLVAGEVVPVGDRTALRIVNTNDTSARFHLLTITNLPPLGARYGVLGEIKYDQVIGEGYLELLNFFSATKPGSADAQYFTRTLGQSGALAKLTGTSGWRNFALPFDRTGTTNPPSKLQISLVLPGRGTVFVGPCRLVDYSGSGWGRWTSTPGAWWSERTGGLLGGTLGATLGCFASLLSILAAKGKARGFVVVSWRVMTVMGGFLLLTGVAAVLSHQPYEVWFVLLLCGGLLALIAPARLRQIQKHYEALELRRMSAADAR